MQVEWAGETSMRSELCVRVTDQRVKNIPDSGIAASCSVGKEYSCSRSFEKALVGE